MTLQGGAQGSNIAGGAVIGTMVNNGAAESNITINAGAITLTGPVGTDNGAARIVNNRPGVSTPASSTRNISLTGVSLTLLGGISTSGFADIYSARDITINLTGDLEVNRPGQGFYKIVMQK